MKRILISGYDNCFVHIVYIECGSYSCVYQRTRYLSSREDGGENEEEEGLDLIN